MSHAHDHSELLALYALQALPPGDVPVVESRLAGCAECRQEMEALQPLVGSLAAWPTDLLRPSASLRDRLAERIAAETGGAPVASAPAQRPESEWQEAAPGITVKLLATDTARGRVSMLVRLAPGIDYPPHRHEGVEELHLLDGELRVDARVLQPGDYLRSEPGSEDQRVWSETGCTCVLMTSFRDTIL